MFAKEKAIKQILKYIKALELLLGTKAEKSHNHDTVYQPKGNYIPTSGGVTVDGTINFYGAEQRFCPLEESYSDPMYGYAAAIKASGTSAFQNIYLKDGIKPTASSTTTYPVAYTETGIWTPIVYKNSVSTSNRISLGSMSQCSYTKVGSIVCINALLVGFPPSTNIIAISNLPYAVTDEKFIMATLQGADLNSNVVNIQRVMDNAFYFAGKPDDAVYFKAIYRI